MIHKFNCAYCGKYVEDENKTRFCSENAIKDIMKKDVRNDITKMFVQTVEKNIWEQDCSMTVN